MQSQNSDLETSKEAISEEIEKIIDYDHHQAEHILAP
jgi:hypothetical protein